MKSDNKIGSSVNFGASDFPILGGGLGTYQGVTPLTTQEVIAFPHGVSFLASAAPKDHPFTLDRKPQTNTRQCTKTQVRSQRTAVPRTPQPRQS